jgi:hypothetical protein
MQADAAELNLCSNCLLKMSFQGHESKSPAQPQLRIQTSYHKSMW